ncbi:prepilin-type N-terminal cleavage/methylation domain-containing protein [Pseudoalteromonas tunicata]|uniref:PilW family protein n=1 Tax=Pseudoalteromonas tunicata TaxID=314281 RepID=UPI00273E877E|nr:prepilin-type N-terminal cleavage/methylation domain-containing protein [Pseudoalteromonas tunicata]MDP5211734.1 prepilin-type N-terminal cleavage/methylation domain-containing protein [Pseudoalteromonas tunicata]
MMRSQFNKQHGYTLIELMVALAASMFLLSGVSMAFVSIKSTISSTEALENSQEVIRSTADVMTRALKQTLVPPTISTTNIGNDTITIVQDANTINCLGQLSAIAYTEAYTFISPNLVCDLGAGNQTLITGVDSISFMLNGLLVTTTVKPIGLPDYLGNGVAIDTSLTADILN